MKNKINPDNLEKLVIQYFNYISQIHNKMRILNHKLYFEKSILNKLQQEEKEYLDMIVSDCTGKGLYHDGIMLPTEIQTQMKFCNLSVKDNEKLQEKYNLALDYAKRLEQRYSYLGESEKQRLYQIKKSKNNIKIYKADLKLLQKEYTNNMNRIRKLDSKLSCINETDVCKLIYNTKSNK